MIRKLRLKFVCINMLLVLVLLCIMMGMVLTSTRARLARDSIQMMRSVAAAPIIPERPDERSEDMRLPVFRLTVSPEGELLSCTGGFYDLSDEEFLYELIQTVREDPDEVGVIDRYQLRFLRREPPSGESVMVFLDITSELRAMHLLMTNCILIGLAGLLLFLVVSILLARWAVRPVEQAWDQQRQFIADASHELKTPLTVILTNTELLQSGSCDAEDRDRAVNSIQVMGTQMRGLVEEMLSLTRAEHSLQDQKQQPLDFSKCVSDAILPFEPIFFEKGLLLESEIEEGISVRGTEEALRQVVEILLDNAQKYCSPETETRVSLVRQGRSALLTVASCGEEISPEDLKKIFRRFYRADKTRSMNHSYGLGLAIAEKTVQAHRGKIWAESREGKNLFFVQLPCL